MLVQTPEYPAGRATKATNPESQAAPEFSSEPAGQYDPSSDQRADPAADHSDADPACPNTDTVSTWIPRSKYRKIQLKQRKQKLNILFNYSNIELTKDMEAVLNRGLNFCVLPLKLDITQILVEFRQFERTVVWQEYWHDADQNAPPNRRIFKSKKHNFPRKHKTPNGVKTFLGAVKSELINPTNRNSVKSNLPENEIKALKELIRLQRERIITIKPNDKGAGIMILNFDEYLRACNEHLLSKQDNKKFYQKVNQLKLDEAKQEIKKVLEEAHDNEIITKDEYDAMNPDSKGLGKFYGTFKVHKEHTEGTAPPLRPIVSGCGSVTENIGVFVEHFLKNVATHHESYLQDTPSFLRYVEELNSEGKLPKSALLVTVDVSSLYTNINHLDATNTAREALSERETKEVPTELLVRLLELVLKYNLFEFDGEIWQQIIGVAMGSKPAPHVANIFLARKVDEAIKKISLKYGKDALRVLKRFLDDLFLVFTGTTTQLHEMFNEMNEIHPNIKFTMSHTKPSHGQNECECSNLDSIPFLDTSCTIKEGKIVLDLYRKPSDRNKYLLPDSCHPQTVVENIPLALSMRITRICSEIATREKRYGELKEMLIERNYPARMVDSAINRARSVPRAEAIKCIVRDTPTTTRRPIFVATWDPRLPPLSPILNKHWRSMVSMDPYLKEVYPEPPLVAHKRTKNIKDFVIRAKVPKPLKQRPQRIVPGMRKCGKMCHLCPYVMEDKSVRNKDFEWKLQKTI